ESDDARVVDRHIIREKCERGSSGGSNFIQAATLPFEDFLVGSLCGYESDRILAVDCRKLRQIRKALSAICDIHEFNVKLLKILSKSLSRTRQEQEPQCQKGKVDGSQGCTVCCFLFGCPINVT